MQVWATLLALEQDGEMVVGVVSAPSMGRRWWAARGAGAFTTDVPGGEPRRMRVSGIRGLQDAQMCFGGFEEWRQTERLTVLLALSERCWRTRGYGDFWQYMLVAEGAAEIALDPAVALWDVAAPMVIVQEAGGRFTDFGGSATAAGGDGIGSNGLVHEAARQILAG
jgi:histidinol-phosphatase